MCDTYKLYTYLLYYNWTDLCITAYKFVFFPCSTLVIFCHLKNKGYMSRYCVFFLMPYKMTRYNSMYAIYPHTPIASLRSMTNIYLDWNLDNFGLSK